MPIKLRIIYQPVNVGPARGHSGFGADLERCICRLSAQGWQEEFACVAATAGRSLVPRSRLLGRGLRDDRQKKLTFALTH
jgi:hypothetical protein